MDFEHYKSEPVETVYKKSSSCIISLNQ